MRNIAAVLLFTLATAALAQTYPAKPVTIVIPNAAGGPADVYGRIVAQPMSRNLRQPLVVENVGGAGGNIGITRVARAAPDGYTILYHNIGMATNPAAYRKLEYDPIADFEPIGAVTHSVLVLVARNNFTASNLRELIGLAKASGDRLTLSDAGQLGPSGLCSLLLQSAIGVKLTTVSYKGTAPALNDVLGGQVDMLCDSSSTAARYISAGKVKAIGVTSRTRLATLPDVPSMDEQGLKGFELLPWTAMYAPRGTPRAIVDRVAAALQAGLADAEVIAQYDRLGLIPARELASPAALAVHLKAETEKWGALIRKAGIQPE